MTGVTWDQPPMFGAAGDGDGWTSTCAASDCSALRLDGSLYCAAHQPVVRRDDPPPAREGAARIEPKRGTRKALVLGMLRRAAEAGPAVWVDGAVLTQPSCGGSEGLRRLRELRRDGWGIESRPHPDSQTAFQYRLTNEGAR